MSTSNTVVKLGAWCIWVEGGHHTSLLFCKPCTACETQREEVIDFSGFFSSSSLFLLLYRI